MKRKFNRAQAEVRVGKREVSIFFVNPLDSRWPVLAQGLVAELIDNCRDRGRPHYGASIGPNHQEPTRLKDPVCFSEERLEVEPVNGCSHRNKIDGATLKRAIVGVAAVIRNPRVWLCVL